MTVARILCSGKCQPEADDDHLMVDANVEDVTAIQGMKS